MSSAAASSRRPLPAPEREEPARSRHLRVAPDPHAHRRRSRLLLWLAAAVTTGALFVLVSFHVFAAQHEFALDRLERERSAEQRRYEHLRARVATMAAPDAVVKAAEALGMVPAGGSDFITVPDAAGGPRTRQDRTTSTLDESWRDAKSSLVAEP